MKIAKAFISIILLFTYTLGFAHNLVPHHMDIGEHGNETAFHEHHQHNDSEELNPDHNHHDHGDHFDEGLYDFILCFFSELEQPSESCSVHYYFPAESTKNVKQFKSNALLATYFALALKLDFSQEYSISEIEYFYSSPLSGCEWTRGPPSIS